MHDNISCTVPMVKGFIKIRCEKNNGKAIINLEYPENCEITLHTPENAPVNANTEKHLKQIKTFIY